MTADNIAHLLGAAICISFGAGMAGLGFLVVVGMMEWRSRRLRPVCDQRPDRTH